MKKAFTSEWSLSPHERDGSNMLRNKLLPLKSTCEMTSVTHAHPIMYYSMREYGDSGRHEQLKLKKSEKMGEEENGGGFTKTKERTKEVGDRNRWNLMFFPHSKCKNIS